MKPLNNLTAVATRTENDKKDLKRVMSQQDCAKIAKIQGVHKVSLQFKKIIKKRNDE